jgi:predicted PurR-regulated permease PerM
MAPGVSQPDSELERRISSRLLDVLIRAGLLAVLAVLCYTVFAPFLTLMAWAVILAITIYPLQQSLAFRLGGKQGVAATVVVVVGCVLIVAPTAVLMDSFGSSIHDFIGAVKDNTLEIPPPRESVRE